MSDATWDAEFDAADSLMEEAEELCKEHGLPMPEWRKWPHMRTWEVEPILKDLKEKVAAMAPTLAEPVLVDIEFSCHELLSAWVPGDIYAKGAEAVEEYINGELHFNWGELEVVEDCSKHFELHVTTPKNREKE